MISQKNKKGAIIGLEKLVIIGLIVALFFGATTLFAFAPWYVWAVILIFLISLTGGKNK